LGKVRIIPGLLESLSQKKIKGGKLKRKGTQSSQLCQSRGKKTAVKKDLGQKQGYTSKALISAQKKGEALKRPGQ